MKKENTFITDLTIGNVTKHMLTLSVPFIISNVLQAAYSMVDMIIVGQYVGSDGLSAVSSTSQIVALMTTLSIGLSMGGQIIIAQLIGADKKNRVNEAIGNLFVLNFIVALIVTLIGVLFYRQIISMIGVPQESFKYSAEFLVISSAGMVFTFGFNVVSSVLRGMGDSIRPMVIIGGTSVLNVILGFLFVGIFNMEVAGAALATLISQGVSFIASIIYLYKKKEQFEFDFKLNNYRIKKDIMFSLTKLGFPIALQGVAINVSMLCVIGFINSFGVTAAATFGVGRKIEQTAHMVNQAVGYASASMIGQNIGAQQYSRVRKTVFTAIWIGAIIFGLLSIIYIFVPRQAFAIFTRDTAVLDMAKMLSYSLLLAVPANIFITAMNSLMQGVGNARLCFLIAVLDGVVTRISLCYLLGNVMGFGLQGYFFGYALAGYVTAVPGVIYFFSGYWKRKKNLKI